MAIIRKTLLSLVAATTLAGTGVVFAGDALAVAKAPNSWQCQHAVHYFGDDAYDSYKGTCLNAPANQKFALLITCKTGPGAYENKIGNWVYGRDGGYIASNASCHELDSGRDGVYTGSYEYLGS